MNYKLIVSYDGTNFFGYAKQPQKRTVQGEIESSLSKIFNEQITIYASGRTDKGVHALNQVINFKSDKVFEPLVLKNKLNKMLDEDIHIKEISYVKDDFSSRFSAKKKCYIYIINLAELNPFLRNYDDFEKGLDINKIEKAMGLFLGKHNFQNFTSKESDEDNFVREIYSFKIKKAKEKVIFEIIGNGFMKYMVRKIIGTLIEIGKGKIDESFIKDNLDTNSRLIVNFTAKSCGLYLKKVYY